jgi:hypothetical protein
VKPELFSNLNYYLEWFDAHDKITIATFVLLNPVYGKILARPKISAGLKN